ncbi:hypothetical protein [Thauera sp. Sel9]|uniref:hypothetical protein n=1 Tax=Thauera sp. Sel9 TaxID=2974299 RepID=UPI0021E148F5|nr:hypothetical protein [Thauera sp. Sel9]MCV2217662.1 hypothetical protein [Thauera sp. Sel9]
MRRIPFICVTLSVMIFSACTTLPERIVKEEPAYLMLVGVDKIPAEIKGAPVYVSFENSTSMTRYLTEAFSKGGFQIVENSDQARYVILVSGHFQSKGKINIPPIELGPIFDWADAALEARDYRTATTGETLITIGASVQTAEMFNAGYLNNMGGNILGAIAQATGISGRFNQMLVGDPRGVCLQDCADRDFSRQKARVEAYLFEGDVQLSRFGRAAEAYQPAFIPQELIYMALEGTVNAVFEGARQ